MKPPSPRPNILLPKLPPRHRTRTYTLPNPTEVAQLAHSAWLKEGALPGLEPQYQREIEFQLRFTRHLLMHEIADQVPT